MHLFQNQKVVNQKLPNLDGVQITIKREDLLHNTVSGNKFRKLKYNLDQATREGYNSLLTFGGPFSNHLAATAAATNKIVKTISIDGADTYVVNTEKLVLDNGDMIQCVASAASSIYGTVSSVTI